MKWEQTETWAKAETPLQWEVRAKHVEGGAAWAWVVTGIVIDQGSVEAVEAVGVEPNVETTMGAATNAYERLVYAFCTESPEDMPHALSSLLEAAETLLWAKLKGLTVQANYDNFEGSVAFARRVLSRVPKMGPP